MEWKKKEIIRQAVRKRYAGFAQGQDLFPLAGERTPCCGKLQESLKTVAIEQGYSMGELVSVPDGVNMGLGCGNPTAIASLKPGERVLDLGSGGGFDCFLAARAVGKQGKVIGVDMTPEMVSKSRENANASGAGNVEFRLGEIEHLPVEDNSIDVIISNCVINLSPEKQKVFSEAYRVLKGGGRLAVSDIVATSSLPEEIREDLSLISECIGGAEDAEAIQRMLVETGFENVRINLIAGSRNLIRKWLPGKGIEDYIVSAIIEAVKPLGREEMRAE